MIQSCIINVQDMPLGSNMITDSIVPYTRKTHTHTFCWKLKANLLLLSTTLVLDIFIFMTFNLILYDFHLTTDICFYYKFHLKFILQDNRLSKHYLLNILNIITNFNTFLLKIGKYCQYVIKKFLLHNPLWTVYK